MLVPDEITALVKRLRLVWFAMMASVTLFAAVVWTLIRRGVRFPPLPPILMTYGAVIVVLMIPLARLVRKKLQRIPPRATGGEVARRWQTGWIVSQAMLEAVGIVGSTLGLLYGSPQWVLAFAVASVLSIGMSPPWEHEIRLLVNHAATDPEQTSGGSGVPPFRV